LSQQREVIFNFDYGSPQTGASIYVKPLVLADLLPPQVFSLPEVFVAVSKLFE
jgi:hypothetical protein